MLRARAFTYGAGVLMRIGAALLAVPRRRGAAARGTAGAPEDADRTRRLSAVLAAVAEHDLRGVVVRDGRDEVVQVNAAAARMLGSDRDIAGTDAGTSADAVVDEHGQPVGRDGLPDRVARATGRPVAERVLGFGGDEGRWLAVAAVPVDTPDGRWVVTQLRDVTAETSAVVRLRRQAAVDPLTGVGNRWLLQSTVEALVDPAEQVGIALLDIDDFKAVNDAHGHEVGDQVLREIGERLRAACRPDDVAVRLGGDEFVVVLRRLGDAGTADAIVGRVVRALRDPFSTDAGVLDVACSVGWTAGSALEATALVREADRRMYATKNGGAIELTVDR